MASAILFGLLAVTVMPARAQSLTNGNFEAGLAGWTVVDEAGGSGTWTANPGVVAPLSGLGVPAPPEGLLAALTDQTGPGSHVLYQDFVVPVTPIGSAALSFQLFLQNSASDYFIPDPNSLSYAVSPNQQARVDIIDPSVDPFTVAPADIFLNIYQTMPGDPLVSGYSPVSVDLTAFLNARLGQTLRLRFAEADNQLFFQMGVDDVVLRSTEGEVPEPSTALIMGIGAGVMALRRRLRRR